MISSKAIRHVFKKAFPNLKHLWLRDKEYYAPTIDELKDFIEANTPIARVGDCDDSATILHGKAKEEGRKNFRGTWAFGDCMVDKMLDRDVFHALCVAVTSNQKIWMIDPESGGYWVANPKEDNIYFILM